MTSSRELAAVILAAGHGKRMKSDLPKVLHPVGGQPMVTRVIRTAKAAGVDKIVTVVGYKREDVIPVVEAEGVRYAVQHEQLGTGHATQSAKDALGDFAGDILVLAGDVPLLTEETIRKVTEYHREKGAVATIITAMAPDPTGYGRMIRGGDGNVAAIREHKDCSPEELQIAEINSGIYLLDANRLWPALQNLNNDNAQGEYYLTDVAEMYVSEGETVAAFVADYAEITGVNNTDQLAEADQIWRERNASA